MRRTAFVTGGAGAIGSEICRRLSRDGFNVVIGYCESGQSAAKLAEELCGEYNRSIAVKCDVTDCESIQKACKEIAAIFGFADTVVNNAGSASYKLLGEESEQSIRNILEINLNGAINVCRVFSPNMVSNRFGRIVNIASVWGICGASMESVYSAAKAGLIGFTKGLALELAPNAVTVNAVSPGFIDTPMNKRFSVSEREDILAEIPSCRFGTVADVAAAVGFLAEEDASYIVGQNIVVSGGYKC